MVKFVKVIDDSEIPYLGLAYSGEGLIVSSAFSFVDVDIVRTRLRKALSRLISRGRVLTRWDNKDLEREARIVINRIRASLADEMTRLSLIDKLDQRGLTDFERKVYFEVLRIPLGQVSSYKEIASRLNTSPRAVGQSLARNPFSPIIPCHRVIRSDGSLGGFWGSQDPRDKALMLALERDVAKEIEKKRFINWR